MAGFGYLAHYAEAVNLCEEAGSAYVEENKMVSAFDVDEEVDYKNETSMTAESVIENPCGLSLLKAEYEMAIFHGKKGLLNALDGDVLE